MPAGLIVNFKQISHIIPVNLLILNMIFPYLRFLQNIWNWVIFLQYQKQSPDVFCKKGVLRNFSKFTGKHLCQGLFFNKVAGLRPATILKNRLWHKCFHGNIRNKFTMGKNLHTIVSYLIDFYLCKKIQKQK